MKQLIKAGIEKLKNTGFFHIFGATLINKILGFLSNFIVVRLIEKSAYGVYTYANNILSFVLLLSGLGMVSGVFQLCSEKIGNREEMERIYAYGSAVGIGFNFIIAMIIFCVARFYTLPIPASNHLLMLMALTPIINILFEFQQIYLRFNLKNQEYSYASTINTALLLICSVIGSVLFKEEGLIFARYFAYILSSLLTYKLFRAPIKLYGEKLIQESRKVLYRISIISMFNNGLSQMLYLLDIFVLGLVVVDESIIASYKIATVIPTALYFIPSAVCTYVYPYFAMNKDNKKWLIDNYKRLTFLMMTFNAVLTVGLCITSPIIIRIFFGKQYLDAVSCFRILIIGYFFNGTFRGIAGNLLVTQRRLKFNLFEGLISGGINIIGNALLIPALGSIGAAYTTLGVMLISSLLSTGYFIYVLKKKK